MSRLEQRCFECGKPNPTRWKKVKWSDDRTTNELVCEREHGVLFIPTELSEPADDGGAFYQALTEAMMKPIEDTGPTTALYYTIPDTEENHEVQDS